jgi:hypothetical protein
LFLFSASSGADEDVHGCSEMEVWDITRWMCMPLPMADMPMTMLMLHGNAFAVRIWEQGPRARDAWAGPGMVMAELGTSVGNRHYLNLEFMGTADKWTFPDRGYPLLTQIGEQDANGRPFVDAQHPHSSPVMGLTLSDTIKLDSGEKDYLKPFFAPRGQSTDGPIAFMHRPTGMANPDAPLGHHVGQDVGHISSTVIGASLKLGAMIYEASTFHGTEPLPENVDLPVRTPNSGAFRILREFTPRLSVMASVAYVRSPEPTDPDISSVMRYSMSGYHQIQLSGDWTFFNSLIFGAITGMDHASSLYSFAEEFLFSSLQSGHPNFWGRIELLQRTSDQLVTGAVPPTSARWVEATTLGYTHTVAQIDEAKLGLGGSVTKTLLPGDFIGPYGGDPWSGKVFLQLSGMKMWGL